MELEYEEFAGISNRELKVVNYVFDRYSALFKFRISNRELKDIRGRRSTQTRRSAASQIEN